MQAKDAVVRLDDARLPSLSLFTSPSSLSVHQHLAPAAAAAQGEGGEGGEAGLKGEEEMGDEIGGQFEDVRTFVEGLQRFPALR
jgi:hypothetical protein